MKSSEEHVEDVELLQNNNISTIKTIDSSVFDNFKKLTNSEDGNRINATLNLLQHFSKVRIDQKVNF